MTTKSNDDSTPLLTPSHTRKNSFGYKSIELNAEDGIDAANNGGAGADSLGGDTEDQHKTTVGQTFIHLLKGYMGAGCLSLPWAISQLGFFWGPLAIFGVSLWSSYNSWAIVKLKRFIERESANTNEVDDKASESSSVTTNTQVTYAAVGEFFYGTKFESYVAACICTQQLAICTVFISFVGENLLAVMDFMGITFMATHAGVMTLEMPLILGLSLIPNIKGLSPFMAMGTFLLIVTFLAIGVIIVQVWPDRPMEPIEVNLASAPLAVCAILYSYEGINLVLPVESAMAEPQHFKAPFIFAMICTACILAGFSVICVLAFGDVTSGSVTAFLIEAYSDDPQIMLWLMVANSAVSLSVLLTYPLQLFPVLELVAPSFSRFLAQDNKDELDGDDDLSAFEPLPPLPEHDVPDYEEWSEHQYNADEDPVEIPDAEKDGDTGSVAHSAMTSIQSMLPEMTMPGDSPLLRVVLVLTTYTIAVVVPNVQALISLAGALAGSSSALLIPPLLELAWVKNLESIASATSTSTEDVATSAVNASGDEVAAAKDDSRWTQPFGLEWEGLGKWWMEKTKCYILFLLGFVFFLVGTFSSLVDIVRIYTEG